MKVFVSGSEGLIGKAVCGLLTSCGHVPIGFDIQTGADILDPLEVNAAAAECDAIIHCAALLTMPGQTSSDIMTTNLLGTWNVLQTAAARHINKVVFLSSVDVLGVFKGEKSPDFLPLGESHPCYPTTPYGISKYLGEQICRRVASATSLSIVCLRPPGVWESVTYEWVASERQKRPEFEWDPFWEYGAFIDVRDLAAACLAALEPSVVGFHTLFVSANDITTSGATSYELCQRIHPDVSWLAGNEYIVEPYRTLLRNDAAQKVLNWQPIHSWRNFRDRNE